MTNSSSPSSLQSIIFLRIAPLASLILLAILVISSSRISRTLRREVQERVDTSAKYAAQQIESEVSSLVSACQAVAANDLVVNGIVDMDHRNSTLRSYFRALRLPGPGNQQVTMADYKGRTIVSTTPNQPSLVGVPWYENVMAGRDYVGIDAAKLTVAVPVLYGGRSEAVIVAVFDLVELVSDRLSVSEIEAVVFHSQGEVLYSTEAVPSELTKKFQNPNGWLVGTSRLSNLPNYEVSYLESERTALAAARHMSISQLIQFFVLLIGLLAAIRMAAQFASQPLNKMLQEVGGIEKTGDLNLRVAQHGPAELQTLAEGFNGMLGKLQRTTVSREKYRVNEERLTFAIQGTNDGLWDWDMVTNEVWYSPRYKAMLGYTDEDFPDLLTSFENHLHPDDASSTWNAVERHLEGSAEYDVEHRLKTKSGGYLWVRARGAVTRDDDGKPIRMSGSMQDISIRRRYQTDLQNKTLELENVVDAMPIAMIQASPDRKVLRVNQAFTDVFGYTEEQIVGQSTSLLYVDPAKYQQAGETRFNADVQMNLTPYEVEYRRKDGSTFIGESVGTVLFDSEENPVGKLGLITDVSDRKSAERDLRINKFAVDKSSDAVFWIQTDGSFSQVNEQAAQNLGYSKEELCQLCVSDINPDYPIERWGEHWEETKKRGVLQFETVHHRKDGSTYDCVVTKHYLSFEGAEIIFATARDVTFENETKAALIQSKQLVEESEQRFRALADSSAPLCWVTELDTSCSWLNKRWVEYSGKTMEEHLGFGWVEMVHPDDRKPAQDVYLSAFEKQDSFELSYRLLRHDGVYRWHTVNATPRFDEKGTFLGMVGMSFDTHEAKESRDALEASELALKDASESLRATLELLGKSDGVWDWKIDSEETVYTPGFRKILGFDGDDHESFPNTMEALNSRIHPDDKAALWQEIEQSYESRSPFAFEFRVRCKDNEYIWVRSRGSASFDEDGNPVHLVGSIYDISAQKDVELERDRFLATAAELYAAFDLDTLRWVQLNAAGPALLGYSREELFALPLPAVHPVEEHETIRRQVQRLRNGESVRSWVSPIRHRDGSTRYIEWNIDPPLPGQAIVYGAGRDVTKVREYLEQIEETTRKLEELNRQYEQSNSDLAQFAYVASHDLQEPLRAVGGFLQLLQRDYQNQLDDRAKGYIEKSVAGAARMSELINDLLYYSRVTSAGHDFELVDLNQCMEKAINTLSKAIEDSEANVQVADLPSVQGIEPLLVQLFQNLIGNAIKYGGDRSPVVEIWAESMKTEILVHVKDNGIGIDKAYQDQVFALFKRLHHRGEYSGTGIGLAICQRVAIRHGGSISVKSNADQGSCFTVRLERYNATDN